MKYNVKAFGQEFVFYPYEHLTEVVRWAQYKGEKQGEEVNPVVLEITEVDDTKAFDQAVFMQTAMQLRKYADPLAPQAPESVITAFDDAWANLER